MRKFKLNLYKYDSNKLDFIQYSPIKLYCVLSALLVIIIFSSFSNNKVIYKDKVVKVYVPEITKDNILNEENVIREIKKYNFKYPEIVLAQIYAETGMTSRRAIDENNITSMQVATSRLTISTGLGGNFCIYDKWQDAILDYALYYATYIGNNMSKQEYLEYVDKHYDLTPNVDYHKRLLNIIRKQRLKEKFSNE